MPIELDPRLVRKGPRIIGDWSSWRKISGPPDDERRAMMVEPDVSENVKRHAKVTPPKDTRDGIISPDDPFVKVKMKKTFKAAPDRVHVIELKKGEIYEVPESFAKRYFAKGYATKVKEIKKGDKK